MSRMHRFGSFGILAAIAALTAAGLLRGAPAKDDAADAKAVHEGAAKAATNGTPAKPGADADARLTGGKAARILSLMIPRAHLYHQDLDDEIAGRALDIYIDMLDFDHTFFMAPDIEQFRKEAGQLDDMVKSGDLSFAYRVHDLFMERVRNRMDYVGEILKKKPDLKSDETYRWKRKDAPWAANEQDWNDLWRRKIKNDYVARVVSVRMAEETAKKEREKEKEKAKSDRAKKGSGKNAGAAETNATAAAADSGKKDLEKQVVSQEADRKDLDLSPEEFIRKRYKQFRQVLEDSDDEMVVDRFLSAFTQAFDPHSEYMSASQTEDFDITMKLSLFGIGAQLSSEDGAAKIEKLIKGGPAERDGRLKVGDRIIGVGQGDGEPEDILHWPLNKAVRKIRGEKGTKVTLVYWPASDVSGGTEKRIQLVREEVKLEEQAAKSKIHEIPGADGHTNRIGVITLPEFYADFKAKDGEARRCAADVKRILTDLGTQDVTGVALDLRSNGGGSLPDAIEMAGFFVRSGPIVQVRDSRNVQVIGDPDPGVLYEGPLVVLVNRMSASASEIVAAALQDYGRAVVVGDTKTHGKGTVQTLLPLDQRNQKLGSFKVTTASFYRIAGGSTQVKGVASDIVVPSFFDRMELGEEFLPHALPWSVVNPAFYATLLDQAPPLDILRERSEKRRAANPAFKVRDELITRLGKRLNDEDISLNLEERMKVARADKDLDEQQRAAGDTAGDDKDDTKDLVLMESLQVLSDMISWKAPTNTPAAVANK